MTKEELAEQLAEQKAEELASMLKDAYLKGYEQGRFDANRTLRVDGVTYVDLGLPSGTLWSADYEKDEGELMYVPYELTADKSIPTKEQWKELKKCAKWEFIGEEDKLTAVKCTGPNGNTLLFRITGLMDFAKITRSGRVFFWVRSAIEKNCAVHMWTYNNELHEDTDKQNSNLKLPLRLVQAKQAV